MTAPLPELVLYMRDGCHLCDEARALVQGLLEDRAARALPIARVVERDITANPEWERRFFDTIPVVEVRGRRLPLAISAAKLRAFLAETLDQALA